MKLKEQKKFGILWLSIGAALFLAGLLLGETEYGSYISGFSGGLTAVGLVRLLRVRRNRKNGHETLCRQIISK